MKHALLTVRFLAAVVATVVATVVAAGCASTGAVPRPFPGAPIVVTAPPLPTPPAAEPPTTAVPAAPQPALATALALRGTPYRYGGSDPAGFDCSGLVQWVFRQHGIALPRETREQFEFGAVIDSAQIEPGDLVFFDTEGDGASHVGIALDRDSFVHAPNSRGIVRVERFGVEYWSRRYLGARRVWSGPP